MVSSTLTLFKVPYTLIKIPPPRDMYLLLTKSYAQFHQHSSRFLHMVLYALYMVPPALFMVPSKLSIILFTLFMVPPLKYLFTVEFGSRFLACFDHLVTISHCSTTNAHGSINRAHVSTINTNINIIIELI